MQDLDKLKSKAGGTFEEVKSLVGRLNHASYVMPITPHYLTDPSINHPEEAQNEPSKLWNRRKSRPRILGKNPQKSQGRDIDQPCRYPATKPSVLVRRLPTRNGRVQHLGKSLANSNSHGIRSLTIRDNTSAIKWFYPTSRIEIALRAHEAHHRVARKLAELFLENEICIADFLSFAGTNERGKPHPYAYDDPNDK